MKRLPDDPLHQKFENWTNNRLVMKLPQSSCKRNLQKTYKYSRNWHIDVWIPHTRAIGILSWLKNTSAENTLYFVQTWTHRVRTMSFDIVHSPGAVSSYVLTRVFTYGSVKEAIKTGCSEIYIIHPRCNNKIHFTAAGRGDCTNFTAETIVLLIAMQTLNSGVKITKKTDVFTSSQ